MRKYWVKTAILAVLSALLLTGTALAAGTEEEPEPTAGEEGTEETVPAEEGAERPVEPLPGPEADIAECELPELINEKNMPLDMASLLSAGSWSGTRYRDQLIPFAKEIYDDAERAFRQGTVSYENVTFNTKEGQETCLCAVYEKELQRVSYRDSGFNTILNNYRSQYSEGVLLSWLAFMYDHPEYVWIRYDGNGVISFNLDDENQEYVIVAKFLYTIRERDYLVDSGRKNVQAAIGIAVDNILGECEGISTVAKLAYFDNWLANHNEYNKPAGYNSSDYASYNPNYMKEISS